QFLSTSKCTKKMVVTVTAPNSAASRVGSSQKKHSTRTLPSRRGRQLSTVIEMGARISSSMTPTAAHTTDGTLEKTGFMCTPRPNPSRGVSPSTFILRMGAATTTTSSKTPTGGPAERSCFLLYLVLMATGSVTELRKSVA